MNTTRSLVILTALIFGAGGCNTITAKECKEMCAPVRVKQLSWNGCECEEKKP